MIPSPLQAKWNPSDSRTLKPHKGGGGDRMRRERRAQSPSPRPHATCVPTSWQLSEQTCVLTALLRLLVPQGQCL